MKSKHEVLIRKRRCNNDSTSRDVKTVFMEKREKTGKYDVNHKTRHIAPARKSATRHKVCRLRRSAKVPQNREFFYLSANNRTRLFFISGTPAQ